MIDADAFMDSLLIETLPLIRHLTKDEFDELCEEFEELAQVA